MFGIGDNRRKEINELKQMLERIKQDVRISVKITSDEKKIIERYKEGEIDGALDSLSSRVRIDEKYAERVGRDIRQKKIHDVCYLSAAACHQTLS